MKNTFFKKTTCLTRFLGRNGYFKCIGINTCRIDLDDGSHVMISPITSRRLIGRCKIDIPVEDIPEVIKQLQEEADKDSTAR